VPAVRGNEKLVCPDELNREGSLNRGKAKADDPQLVTMNPKERIDAAMCLLKKIDFFESNETFWDSIKVEPHKNR
jgi:hypothetical protein